MDAFEDTPRNSVKGYYPKDIPGTAPKGSCSWISPPECKCQPIGTPGIYPEEIPQGPPGSLGSSAGIPTDKRPPPLTQLRRIPLVMNWGISKFIEMLKASIPMCSTEVEITGRSSVVVRCLDATKTKSVPPRAHWPIKN